MVRAVTLAVLKRVGAHQHADVCGAKPVYTRVAAAVRVQLARLLTCFIDASGATLGGDCAGVQSTKPPDTRPAAALTRVFTRLLRTGVTTPWTVTNCVACVSGQGFQTGQRFFRVSDAGVVPSAMLTHLVTFNAGLSLIATRGLGGEGVKVGILTVTGPSHGFHICPTLPGVKPRNRVLIGHPG